MRQLLLRVDDSLHARLTARAKIEQRSVNALANEILAVAASGTSASAREQTRFRAAALGILAPQLEETEQPPPTPEERDRILAGTRGFGAVVDDVLAEDRDRR